MVRGILMPALWLRGGDAAAAEENASASTAAVVPSLGGNEAAAVAASKGASTYAGVSGGEALSPASVAFGAVTCGPDQQGVAAAAATARRGAAPPAAAALTRLAGVEHGGALEFCGVATVRPCSSEDDAEVRDVLRGSAATGEVADRRDSIWARVSAAGKGGKLPLEDFDPEAAPTAATLIPDTGDGLFDEEDVKDSDSSGGVSRPGAAVVHNERNNFRRLSDEGPLVRKKGKTGFFATGVIILKSFVGGAFLFLPHAVIKAGLAVSFVTLTGIFMLAVYCMTLLVRCCEASERRAAAGGAPQDGERRSSSEGSSTGLCSTATGNCSEGADSGKGKKKGRDGSSVGSYRWFLRPPQRLFFHYSRKDSSSSSNDSTRTGDSGGRRLTEDEEEEQEAVRRVSPSPTHSIRDCGAGTGKAPQQLHQQISSKHQQLTLDNGAASLQQQKAGWKLTGGKISGDREGAADTGSDFVVGMKDQHHEKDASEQYDCKVVVASLPEEGAAARSARCVRAGGTEGGCVVAAGSAKPAEEEEEEGTVSAVAEVIDATATEVADAAASVKETSNALLCSYEGVARHACGVWGERLIEFCVVLSQLSFATVNVALVAGNVRDVVWTAADCAPAYNWSLKAIIWSTALLYVPLCLLKRMKHLVPLALLANVGTAVGVVLLMVAISLQLAERQQLQPAALPLARWSHWPLILGTSIYLWEGAGLVLPIRQEAKQKVQKRFSAFFSGSLAVLLLLYVIYSLICCIAFRDELQIIILFNLSSGPLSLTVQTIVALAILATYPLMMFPALSIVDRHLLARSWVQGLGDRRRKLLVYVVRALLALLTLGVATVGMRHLDDFVALIGGLCGAPLVFVFPVCFHMRLVEEERYRRLFHRCVIVAGIAIQAFSVYWSIASWKGDSEFASRCMRPLPAP